MIEKSKTLIFTGGHHTSSLVVAKALARQGWQIVWFGHRHSMWHDQTDSAEYREVTAAGFNFIDLKAGKFYKTYNPLKLIRLPFGFIQAFLTLLKYKLILKKQLKGIVSFGGYLAVPTVIGGWLLKIPSLTHEQTVTRGWANQFITPFVKAIAVSWPQSLAAYPPAKTVVTGLPVRPELLELKKTIHRTKTIYITGGKQGSHTINQTVFSALPELVGQYQLIHQTGSSSLNADYQMAQDLAKKYPAYSVFDFDSTRAIAAMAQADLVISRAGAHTVYELAVLGIRAVLVPIPWVSHNEQLHNARLLADHQQAVILPQDQLTVSELVSSIKSAFLLSPKKMTVSTRGLENMLNLIQSTFC